jgi:hypothetical protein
MRVFKEHIFRISPEYITTPEYATQSPPSGDNFQPQFAVRVLITF